MLRSHLLSAVLLLAPLGAAQELLPRHAPAVSDTLAAVTQALEAEGIAPPRLHIQTFAGPEGLLFGTLVAEVGGLPLEIGVIGPILSERAVQIPFVFVPNLITLGLRVSGVQGRGGVSIGGTGSSGGTYLGPTDFVPPSFMPPPPPGCTTGTAPGCKNGPNLFVHDPSFDQCVEVPPHKGHKGEGWVLKLDTLLAAVNSGQLVPDSKGYVWVTITKGHLDALDVFESSWISGCNGLCFTPVVPVQLCVNGLPQAWPKFGQYSEPFLNCQSRTVSVGLKLDCLLAAIQQYANNGTPMPSDKWLIHVGFTLCKFCGPVGGDGDPSTGS